jgi:hypothetical protein
MKKFKYLSSLIILFFLGIFTIMPLYEIWNFNIHLGIDFFSYLGISFFSSFLGGLLVSRVYPNIDSDSNKSDVGSILIVALILFLFYSNYSLVCRIYSKLNKIYLQLFF